MSVKRLPLDLVQVAPGVGSIRIPGLAGSPDIRLAGTNNDEFDITSSAPVTGWTTMNGPGTVNANTDALSHLHLKASSTTAGGQLQGVYKAAPSLPFTMTAKLTDNLGGWAYNRAGIFVGEATPGKLSMIFQHANNAIAQRSTVIVDYWTDPATFSTTISAGGDGVATPPLYLRIVATSSTNVNFYWSNGGLAWNAVVTGDNRGYTVGSVGLAVRSANASFGPAEAFFDWIRFS